MKLVRSAFEIRTRISLLKIVLGLAVFSGFFNAHAKLSVTVNDFIFDFSGKTNIGIFEGKNISLLNSCNMWDHILYVRQATDFTTHIAYGNKTFEHPVIEAQFQLRNKSSWGDPKSISATTSSSVKLDAALIGDHNHFIARQIPWFREAWVEFYLNDVLGLHGAYKHTLTVGFFPFGLGYTQIALGDAYAVGPDWLGFYTESAVDQYAPGLKLSGMLRTDGRLSYDFYVAMLQNKSGTLGDTGSKIRGQEYGRITCPYRDFGRINGLFAMRLNWTVFDEPATIGTLKIEPYGLYNTDPEQKVEFTADADSKLATFGLSGELETEQFAFAFDTAVNVGRQLVRGWDRNVIQVQTRNGKTELVNSSVVINIDPSDPANASTNLSPYLAPYSPSVLIDNTGTPQTYGKTAQTLIDGQIDGSFNNGRLIGVVPGLSAALSNVPAVVGNAQQDGLYSVTNRYRDAYTNKYRGMMGVIDGALFFYDKEVEWSATIGFATGDENPNNQVIDGDFTGFIPLQEFYSGKRVKSAFLLGGAGRLARPLSVPNEEAELDDFPAAVSGFTDIFYVGTGLRWESKRFAKPFSIHPNFLAYWKYDTVHKYNALLQAETKECARNFLGAELNIFAHVYPTDSLKLYFVGSLFIPGGHYKDIRGEPLNSDQLNLLNRLNQTGYENGIIPNIGIDPAFTFNIGFEFSF